MEEPNTYRAVRIDDASSWRLLIYLSKTGMSAYIRNEENSGEPVLTLFSRKWDTDEEGLLTRIETAVYDNPQLLDEFSTDIVICTEKAVWVPVSELEEHDEGELFNEIYRATDEDIFIDRLEDKACLYTLIPGLQGFIWRTLPGARTWCHQTPMVTAGRSEAHQGSVHVNLRKGEADFIAYKDGELQIAVTHPLRFDSEVAYHVINIIDLFGMGYDTEVALSGSGLPKDEIKATLRQCGLQVKPAMLPALESETELPPAVALLLDRNN